MDKTCEFCMSLSPIVYCKADAAHLCLCCDAKIHSANALSFRHPRTLACESCRYQPTHVRCLNHDMFMCQSCDINSHVSFHHQKKIIGCYVGCPSAEDLAELWGFELSKTETEVGSSNLGAKVLKGSSILQQIKDLRNLQLAEGIHSSSADPTRKLPFRHDKMQKTLNINAEHIIDGNLDFQSPNLDKNDEERLGSPFSQLEQAGESSFWQYKTSPVRSNEIWLQNMQDLGVCDEVRCLDDFHIPDVDLTFRNFEELFGNEQIEANVSVVNGNNESMSCSFVSEIPQSERGITSMAEDIGTEQSKVAGNETKLSSKAHQLLHNTDDSVSSFSASRITDESSGSEYKDDGLSPNFPRHQLPLCNSGDKSKVDCNENVTMRHKEKKASRSEKQSQYSFLRSKSDVKKRVKSQALKIESGHVCDSAANVITRSF